MERRMRVLIADDEPRARQFLERLLVEHATVEVVGAAKGGAEALEMAQRLQPDAVFLDIQMPDLSGLEVARHLRGANAPVVVFVTAHDQHAVEAFELAALDYVLKPIERERLAATLERVAREVASGGGSPARVTGVARELASEPGTHAPLHRLPVRHRREVRLLDLSQVPIVFSRDRLVLARSEGHEYLVDYTLQELEERLPAQTFVRVHRAALVNLASIEGYGTEDGVLVLRLNDGTRIEVSERRAAEVRRRLR